MIQRIQTVYLLIVFLINAIGVFINSSVFNRINKSFLNLDILTLDTLFVSIAAISIILSIVTIFNYRKRVLQMRLCQITILLNILFAIVVGIFMYQQQNSIANLTYPEEGIEWLIALFTALFAILAMRGIKSDDELVKSADRFR